MIADGLRFANCSGCFEVIGSIEEMLDTIGWGRARSDHCCGCRWLSWLAFVVVMVGQEIPRAKCGKGHEG